MDKVITVSIGEIFLKGKNIRYFENVLVNNIKSKIKEYNTQIECKENKIFIENVKEENVNSICSALKTVFGVFSFAVNDVVKTDEDAILNYLKMLEINSSFKVVAKRAYKKFKYTSPQFAAIAGGVILENNKNAVVDIFNPKQNIFINIRENATYISSKIEMGLGGLPVSVSGKALSLLSGGIDSPVSSVLAAKRGLKVSFLHFHSYPHTSLLAREKVINLAKLIKPYTLTGTIYMVSATKVQEEIAKHCNDSYGIALLRRFMMRVAEIVCKTYGYKAIITGENLGQVASQTIESLTSTNSVVKSVPILRPLICFDKTEIINLSKQFNTYETSILPYEDCCTVFLPKNPIIKPIISEVIKEENKIEMDNLIDEAIKTMEIVKF